MNDTTPAPTTPAIPKVGDPASYSIGSDSYAVTVIAVSKSGHKVTVQNAKATLVAGSVQSEEQTYKYEPDPNGSLRVFTRRPNGHYVGAGGRHSFLSVGRYYEHRDPSF